MADYGSYIQLAGSILGEMGGQASEADAQRLLQRAMDEYGKIDLPTLQGLAAQELGPGKMEGLKADEGLKGAERQSLDELLRIGRSGGMTLEDKANLNRIRGQSARQAQANNGRVREQMAARGISGGGAELAMQLSGNQAAAQRASEAGLDVAAQAQKRGMDSILAAGRQAGSMSDRDFSQRAQAASAADARARFNADARDRTNRYNAGLGQQQFGNRLALAGGRAGQGANMVGFLGNQAEGRRAAGRGYGKALGNMSWGGGGGSGGGGQGSTDSYDSQWDDLRPADKLDYE